MPELEHTFPWVSLQLIMRLNFPYQKQFPRSSIHLQPQQNMRSVKYFRNTQVLGPPPSAWKKTPMTVVSNFPTLRNLNITYNLYQRDIYFHFIANLFIFWRKTITWIKIFNAGTSMISIEIMEVTLFIGYEEGTIKIVKFGFKGQNYWILHKLWNECTTFLLRILKYWPYNK